MKHALPFLLSAVLLLSGCNLRAQLLGDTDHTYTATYERDGQTHTLTAKFSVQKQKVTALEMTPGGASGLERGRQLAFSANVRRYVLGLSVASITLPASIGEEEQLTGIFRTQMLEKLKAEVGT